MFFFEKFQKKIKKKIWENLSRRNEQNFRKFRDFSEKPSNKKENRYCIRLRSRPGEVGIPTFDKSKSGSRLLESQCRDPDLGKSRDPDFARCIFSGEMRCDRAVWECPSVSAANPRHVLLSSIVFSQQNLTTESRLPPSHGWPTTLISSLHGRRTHATVVHDTDTDIIIINQKGLSSLARNHDPRSCWTAGWACAVPNEGTFLSPNWPFRLPYFIEGESNAVNALKFNFHWQTKPFLEPKYDIVLHSIVLCSRPCRDLAFKVGIPTFARIEVVIPTFRSGSRLQVGILNVCPQGRFRRAAEISLYGFSLSVQTGGSHSKQRTPFKFEKLLSDIFKNTNLWFYVHQIFF